jgi:DNA repair protein RadD
MAELVRDGWLISPTIYAPSAPSETPKASGADYTLAECARVMDHSKLVGSIVEHWRRITPGQTTVCFTSGIPHSRHVVERFRAADIAAEHVDGTTPADERAGILERLASGATQIVSNVDIITEGYDLPRLSCAIMARPTMSLTKYLQMVGRIMRPVNGKSTCTLLDHAGCSVRHGYPTEARTWSLSGRENRRERAAVRVCSYCFCVNKVTATICEHCGEVFPVQSRPRKPLHESDGELVRSAQQRWRAVTPHTRHTRLRDWYRMCHERGYKIGWAHLRFKHVFGHWPSEAERAAARSE